MEASTTSKLRSGLADLLGLGVSAWHGAAKGSLQSLQLAALTTEQHFDGTVFPALDALVAMQEQCATGLLDTLRGERTCRDLGGDAYRRVVAGIRYNRLVTILGKELFGTARLRGEELLLEDEAFRLTYIPAQDSAPRRGPPIFHSGGGIPYGDRLFRLLPETSFYERFTERGLPVYAMELRRAGPAAGSEPLTVATLIDTIERFTAKAYEHAGTKLVLEGYCGHGTQLLAYLAARPEDAAAKVAAVALFVSPVHGPACPLIADTARLMPERTTALQLWLWDLLSGYVPGDSLRISLDMVLGNTFLKTPLGRFYNGWTLPELARIRRVAELSPAQRRDLAGAYWTSPENARRCPIPVDLVRYANAIFTQGLSKTGELPFRYRGQPLSLAAFVRETTIPVLGFYGGADVMIPDRTAYPLMPLLGDRYRHVVHPQAGHISYVFSPKRWDPHKPGCFMPNPIDLIVEAAGRG